jgi:uronate dehydrogenase
MAMQRVLITGAGGGIGRSLRETLRGVYPVLRLSDRVALAPARDGEEIDRTEISDMRVWTALSISAEIPAKTPGT